MENNLEKQAEQLIDTTSFATFCSNINDGFTSFAYLSELYKTGNEDLITIIKTFENGR